MNVDNDCVRAGQVCAAGRECVLGAGELVCACVDPFQAAQAYWEARAGELGARFQFFDSRSQLLANPPQAGVYWAYPVDTTGDPQVYQTGLGTESRERVQLFQNSCEVVPQ